MGTFNGNLFGNRMYGNNRTSDWGGRNDDMFGHEGNDEIYGMRGNDRLFGGADNDLLVGGEGHDDVFGDSGNDVMIYESGNDTFNGGSGTDMLQFRDIAFVTTTFEAVASVITLGRSTGIDYNVATRVVREAGGDNLGTLSLTSVERLTFTQHGDIVTNDGIGRRIETFGGNDRVTGGNGVETIELGDGNDVVDGGRGNDTLSGGAGIDEVSFASWNNVSVPSGQTLSAMISLTGPFFTAGGASLVTTGATGPGRILETDTIFGFENVRGTRFNDSINGSDSANRLFGEDGNDTIAGRGGVDSIFGGNGNDTISGGAGADILNGGAGNDTLDYAGSSGGVVVDLIPGRIGRGGDAEGDRISLFENVSGSNLADSLRGSTAANVLRGNGGSDTIDGFLGNDTLDGGAGRDFLIGGGGRDTLTGGAGADDFIFKAATDSTFRASDTITDFQPGQDRIDLSQIDAISSTTANDSFNFKYVASVTVGANPDPVIVAPVAAGTLFVSATAFDTDDDGVADSYSHTVSGHIDAGGSIDFSLTVITSISSGGLEASDFLL